MGGKSDKEVEEEDAEEAEPGEVLADPLAPPDDGSTMVSVSTLAEADAAARWSHVGHSNVGNFLAGVAGRMPAPEAVGLARRVLLPVAVSPDRCHAGEAGLCRAVQA